MVVPNPTLTEAVVRDLARPQSYDRGENYYEKGAVGEVVWRGETIRAAVQGSQYEPYQNRVVLLSMFVDPHDVYLDWLGVSWIVLWRK